MKSLNNIQLLDTPFHYDRISSFFVEEKDSNLVIVKLVECFDLLIEKKKVEHGYNITNLDYTISPTDNNISGEFTYEWKFFNLYPEDVIEYGIKCKASEKKNRVLFNIFLWKKEGRIIVEIQNRRGCVDAFREFYTKVKKVMNGSDILKYTVIH